MDMIKAMKETLDESLRRGFDNISFDQDNVDYAHLASMYHRMLEDSEMSEAKQGRWLGYAQGVLVAHGILTLEECKKINGNFADDATHIHKKRGSKYKVVGMARAQCSTLPINDGDMLTLYRDVETGQHSVRQPAEFGDGRFEQIIRSEMPTYDKME